jgi:outer membrane protein assembly factor BamB
MKRDAFIFTIGVLCIGSLAMSAMADWPQFLGPDRNNISPETGLLRSWPEDGPRELWSIDVGEGYAGPIIRDGEVYFLDRVEDQTDILRCLSLDSGEELWRYAYEAPGSVGHSGSRNPPTVDEGHVYSVGMMGDLLCIDRKTHEPVWRKNLTTELGAPLPNWGFAQSPVLHKNLVIVAAQAPDAFAVAFDKASGEVAWKSPGLGQAGYVSPLIATLAGVEQLIVQSAAGKDGDPLGPTAGISLEDGSFLWKYARWHCSIPIPNATVLPGDRLFITGGYDAGSVFIQIEKSDEGLKAVELTKLGSDVCGSQIQQPVLVGDHLYINSNSNEANHGMICMTLDGEVKWRTSDGEDQPLFERGSFIYADGMLIALEGRKGTLHLVDPSPEGYKELARAQVLKGRELWAPLALSDGKLIVRSQDTMKCLDLKNP